MKSTSRVLHKYFDATYNRPYYHDTVSGDSLWELPEEDNL